MSSVTTELSERVRRLEDRAAIRRLFTDYKLALDGKDFEAYANVFSEDGEFVAQTGGVRGRIEIRTLVEGMLGSLLGEEAGQDVHLVANPSIDDPRDGQATDQVMWVYVVRGSDGRPELAKVGHYEDDVVREPDGRWRFRRRRAPTDIPAT
jgi:uncharacterized protein (TIGR02246 family)